MSLTRLPS
jgi:ACS family pantothenate transporter-like MFS transporter